MATIQVDAKKAVFYDPDGPNAPLTLQFPLSTTVPDGTRIKLMNDTTSNTPVTYLAQGSDTIANPEEVTDYATSHEVSIPELIIEYMLLGTQWRLSGHGDPDLAKQCIAIFTLAAYGGLTLSTPIAGSDIGVTWDDIDVYDTLKYDTPRHITQDLIGGTLTPLYPGVYRINILLNYSHNESNSSRTTYVRLYNSTDSVAGTTVEIPISRNQPATFISLSIDGELLANKKYVIQIGNGDSITNIFIRAASYSINGIGEFRGDLNAF